MKVAGIRRVDQASWIQTTSIPFHFGDQDHCFACFIIRTVLNHRQEVSPVCSQRATDRHWDTFDDEVKWIEVGLAVDP